ncbi:MAG: tRNA pseudouridine(13) synthase TruD [Methanosphaera sp. rholeuAM130]|nr:MAG: tRNA pseudouridine(13) synthase TruD [Methanosphaera sp. rholeuAM130]
MLNAENFITDFKGTGGNIRCSNEDFYVEEVPLSLPTGQGPNTWIEILKNGKTTLDVVLDVARHLRLSRKRMGFAGMKDKSAVTRQWICVSNITPEELPDDLEDTLYNVKILDIKSNQRKLRIGQLKGNKFKIAIRGIDDCDEACTNAESVLDSLEITGVPNYYGFQRFGELRCNTHLVGKALVEGNIKKAVDTYIGNPAEGEYSQAYQSRQLYDEGKLQESYELMPKSMRYERYMIQELIRSSKKGQLEEKDYIRSIEALPKPLKRMFVNAYGSYLFNKVVNERSKIGINKYLDGDIIIDQDERWVHEINEETIEEDIDNFTLNPTAPLMGSKVPLAEGVQGEIEKKVVEDENISQESFACPKTPKLGSHGIRRSIRFKIEQTNVRKIDDGIEVEFFIPKGCFATAVLREIMKKNV